MRLGAIGFSSYLRRAYIPYLKTRPDVELSAVCDILKPTYLEQLVAEAELLSHPMLFSDLQTMLTSVDLDAVIISTPHTFHFEQAKACLEAGINVLVDKPLACQSIEAQALVALAEAKGLKLAVGNQRRYERPYQYIKQVLQRGQLGEIKLINYLFANSPWYDYSKSWRGDLSLSGGGALMDIGHLAIDMITWLLEKSLHWVDAVALTPNDKGIEQSVAILVEFEPTLLVNFTISYEAPIPSVQEEMSIYGSQGSIFTRRFLSKRVPENPLLIEQSKNGEVHHISFIERPNNGMPLDDFLQGIEKGYPIISDGRSNLSTVELIDVAYRSIREQKKINLTA